MNRVLVRAVTCLMFLQSVSCGYHVLSATDALEFGSLYIAPVENRTPEAGLEDLLHRALVEELTLDRRIRVVAREEAEVLLETSVIRFNLKPTVESGGIAIQYDVEMDGNFRLVRRENGEVLREINGLGSPILTSFSVDSSVLGSRASQEIAETAASRALARELTQRVLLR